MISILENVQLATPEIIILVTACITLLLDLFFKDRMPSIAFTTASFGLFIAALVSFLLLGNFKVILLGGLFISDDVSHLLKLFIYLSVFLGFFYSKDYIKERHMPSGDYYVLGLLSTLGMMILVSAHSLLTIYLGLELLSLPLYAMTAIQRSNSNATEASMKYFVMGAIASGMLLYGISLLYGATGKLDLLDISNSIAINWQQQNLLILFSLVFIMVGIGFKLAAVPFHMWAPDVYQGAPTSVSLFISTAPKIAAMGMAIRLLTLGLHDVSSQWQQILLVMALLSTALGNLIAINQSNLKRLLAYSAISHVGYALFGLLTATTEGYVASIYYIIVYSVMTVAAFGLLVLLSQQGTEIELIDDLKGLNKKNPWLAFMMLIVMFSMAGIPPTVGFFTKLLVLKALVDVNLTWVAVLGLFFAVLGAYYYVKIVKVMYFEDSMDDVPVQLSFSKNIVFSVNCLALLILGIFPSALINACYEVFSG